MKSNFTRKEDSQLTEEQFQELDDGFFEMFMEASPLIKTWLDNVKEVKNFIEIPVYAEKGGKDKLFTILIKKNCCGKEYVCPLCQSVKRVDFRGIVDEDGENQ